MKIQPATTAAALLLLLPLSFAASAAAAAPQRDPGSVKQVNPFFAESTLPYKAPPFDRIRDEHYAPAFERGMKEQRAEIDAIANSKEAPSFENTIVAMERSGRTLARVGNVYYNLVQANTNEAMQKVQTELAPKIAAHFDAINLDGKLFARVQALHAKRDSLDLGAEELRVLERYRLDFVRAGANLDETGKTRLKAINEEFAALQAKFSQNLLKETSELAVVVDNKVALRGLSDDAIAAASEAAKTRKLDGKFVLPLMNTSGQPALASLEDRKLRQRLLEASLSRGTRGDQYDNRELIATMLKLRAERARLQGYPDFATFVLEDETAKNVAAVNKLLGQMAPPAVANAKREAADMQKIIDAEGGGFKLAAWDWAYYAEKVRKERYAYDEQQMRPYFEMDGVLRNGVFFAAEKLYGLTFKERKDLPVYNKDVRVFEVYDGGKPFALFYADFYARDNKAGGAWMNAYVPQSGLFGTTPVVANHLNIPRPPDGQPTLLTYDEVTVMFHEFGHALHGLFSNVKYPRFAGTSVPTDFGEYPSNVNEIWAVDPTVLKNYARHHRTGAPLPQELLDKVQAAAKFNQGFATTEYLAAALLDQAYHQIPLEQVPDAKGILAFEQAALEKAGVDYAPVPPRYRTGYFSHIVGGYAAGYYAYIWSELLDADSATWFAENGGLKRANGDHFRRTVLSRGGSADPMGMFREFRGRDADVRPLLVRRGLVEDTGASSEKARADE